MQYESNTATHFDSPPASGTGHGVHHANVGGFVKASSLLLKDSKKEPWYEVPLLRCKKCTYTKVAGCYCLDLATNDSSFNKSLHRNFESHVQEKDFPRGTGASQNTNNQPSTCLFTPHPMFHSKSPKSELSLCTVPILDHLNAVDYSHFQCRSGECNTFHMKSRGCSACLAPSNDIQVIKVALQRSEIKYAIDGFCKDFGGEIRHTILRCEHCLAIGFPGLGDRLTIIHTEDDGGYEIKHSFWSSKTKKPMSKTSWDHAFGHKANCPMKTSTPRLLESRVRLNDLQKVYYSLSNSVSADFLSEKIQENQDHRSYQRKLWCALTKTKLRQATTDDAVQSVLHQMIEFVLTNKFQPCSSFIYDLPVHALKKYIVGELKSKYQDLARCGMWKDKVRKDVGVLLRVIRALITSSYQLIYNPVSSPQSNTQENLACSNSTEAQISGKHMSSFVTETKKRSGENKFLQTSIKTRNMEAVMTAAKEMSEIAILEASHGLKSVRN